MSALARQTVTPDSLTLVRASDGAVLTVTKQDILDYRATHNLNQTRNYFREMVGTFLEIDPANISNKVLMDIAATGDISGMTIDWGG